MDDEMKKKLVSYAIYVLCGGITLGLIAGCGANVIMELLLVLMFVTCHCICGGIDGSPTLGDYAESGDLLNDMIPGMVAGAGMIAFIALYIYLLKLQIELKREFKEEGVTEDPDFKKAKIWMTLGALALGILAFLISVRLVMMLNNR